MYIHYYMTNSRVTSEALVYETTTINIDYIHQDTTKLLHIETAKKLPANPLPVRYTASWQTHTESVI